MILLLALALPLFLLPVEKLLPLPFLIEELAKLFLVFLILKIPGRNFQLGSIFLSGFLFSLSESLFYLGDAFRGGYSQLFGEKLISVSGLHLLTLFLFWWSGRRGTGWWWVALPVAMILHFGFNAAALSRISPMD